MAAASDGSLSCSKLSTLRSKRSYRCRNSADGRLSGPLYRARNALSRSSTWFFNESLVNTPIACVSRRRCSKSARLSVGGAGGLLGAVAGTAGGRSDAASPARFGGCSPAVALDFSDDVPVPELAACEAVAAAVCWTSAEGLRPVLSTLEAAGWLGGTAGGGGEIVCDLESDGVATCAPLGGALVETFFKGKQPETHGTARHATIISERIDCSIFRLVESGVPACALLSTTISS